MLQPYKLTIKLYLMTALENIKLKIAVQLDIMLLDNSVLDAINQSIGIQLT